MSGSRLGILAAVDRLYEGVVMNPEDWADHALEEWGLDTVSSGSKPSKVLGRELRRCVRAARKLRDFWLQPPENTPSDAGDWRTRVDLVLGARAWRPALEIARDGLAVEPSEELFDEARRRFREVHGTEWMAGRSYEEWLEEEGTSR